MSRSPIYISSFDDPRVDVYRDVRDADLRGRDRLFMAESELVIRRLLRTARRLHSLLLSDEKYAKLRPLLDSLEDPPPVFVAALPLIHEIAAFHVHRGCLAAVWRPTADEISIERVFAPMQHLARLTILVAEGFTNVDNMGALFRNAAAFGVNGILLDPTCCDPLYRKAVRVSMGHALWVPYAVSANWPDDLGTLKRMLGLTLIAAETAPHARPAWQMPKPDRVGLIFGNEGHGLSSSALSHCDAVCEIPMTAEASSLNVSVASAVMLYELRRNCSSP